MKEVRGKLKKKYHDAVVKWQERFFPDYDTLMKNWSKFFPKQEKFCLCSRHEIGTPDTIAVGEKKGQKRYKVVSEMDHEEAERLLRIIKAQASTEFGSIQQHQMSIDKAPDDEEKFFVMRVMAEELRHGYQMFHLLTEDDWGEVTDQTPDEFVEEVLSMETGSHVLGAFNIEYDSFVDNVVFAALIDRVGKYQLTMQKVCAYKPMGDSMPPMLEEEAFHLAAGVVPLRRWVRKAGKGDITISMPTIQNYLNKWAPRGYEMFGHEKGGNTNVRIGFKDMNNAEALSLYREEIQRMVRDLNKNFLRARFPKLSNDEAKEKVEFLVEKKEEYEGISWEDLLTIPDEKFFRRRGMYAYQMWSVDGTIEFDDVEEYKKHLQKVLPDVYLFHQDFTNYLYQLESVLEGEMTLEEAIKKAPRLTRMSYCPCSKSVRWIVEDGEENGTGEGDEEPIEIQTD